MAMLDLPSAVATAARMLQGSACGGIFTGQDPAVVLTAMMGTFSRTGELTGGQIEFATNLFSLPGTTTVAITQMGGDRSKAMNGGGWGGYTYSNGLITVNALAWAGMSTEVRAQTLIHELGHIFNVVTGLGSSTIELDGDMSKGVVEGNAQDRNAERIGKCKL